jgi:glycosyltransferase involved in cell wall biosynthesis
MHYIAKGRGLDEEYCFHWIEYGTPILREQLEQPGTANLSSRAPREPLSAVLITRNAAAVLEPCLDSLAFADEVVIVDSSSTDNTVELAKREGARVVHKEWLGFGRQKQFAVEQASHDWVLCLDADERVSPELAQSIESALAAPVSPVYRMARRNRFLGRWLSHGEGYPDWSPRLFNRLKARWSDDLVHEKVLFAVTPGTLEGDLMHDSSDDLSAYLERQNRYTTLAARQAFEEGRSASLARLFLSPVVRFFKFYVMRLGFLDGVPGLLHISIGCINSYMKYMKLIELRQSEKQAAQ